MKDAKYVGRENNVQLQLREGKLCMIQCLLYMSKEYTANRYQKGKYMK